MTQRKTLAQAAAQPVEPSTTVAQRQPSQVSIVRMLEDPNHLAEIERALPPGLTIDRFARIALTAIKSNSDLMELGASPEGAKSLIMAIHRCAQLGLEPGGDLGLAYLLPFRTKAGKLTLQFILGYKGILTLARRSGNLKRLDVHEVYEADEFEYSYGLDGTLYHKPSLDADRGKVICYYGFAEFSDGGYYYLVMTLADIDARKQRSASVKSGRSSPWDTDPVAMAKKTVVRAMAPFLPLAPEAQDAIADDEKAVTADGTLAFIEATHIPDRPREVTEGVDPYDYPDDAGIGVDDDE